jgi:hypothetical protein
MDLHITYYNRLTGECITMFDICRRKAHCAPPPDISRHHLDGATPTAPLSATWLADLNACQVRGIGQ